MFLLSFLLTSGCILDRTGQSTTHSIIREVQRAKVERQTVSAKITSLQKRIESLEVSNKSNSKIKILQIENIEELRTELANLSDSVEQMGFNIQNQDQTITALTEDSAFRLEEIEERTLSIEKKLGMEDDVSTPPDTQTNPSEAPQSPTPPTETQEQSAQDLLEKAKAHLEAERYTAAEAVLKAHIEQFPKDATHIEALYQYGLAAIQKKDYQEAIQRFQAVPDTDSKSTFAAMAIYYQGVCFYELKDKDSAKLFWNDVITEYPKSGAAKLAKERLKSK